MAIAPYALLRLVSFYLELSVPANQYKFAPASGVETCGRKWYSPFEIVNRSQDRFEEVPVKSMLQLFYGTGIW